MKRIALIVAATVAIMPLSARKQTTMRPKSLKPIAAEQPAAAAADTLTLTPTDITPSGYVKPLNARSESMLLSNKTQDDFTAVELQITYTDVQGRELSSRTEWVSVNLPAGATRRIDLPTWDAQNSYYYEGGKTPRTPRVTPYRVKVIVRKAIIGKARE